MRPKSAQDERSGTPARSCRLHVQCDALPDEVLEFERGLGDPLCRVVLVQCDVPFGR